MKERPILFSAPMVRAILDGRKTQTRRIVKPQPEGEPSTLLEWASGLSKHCYPSPSTIEIEQKAVQLRGKVFPFRKPGEVLLYSPVCPCGKPGDRLWVRETWNRNDEDGEVCYRADCTPNLLPDTAANMLEHDRRVGERWARWRPSIHMPRRASRITLEVTGVRIERLQDISEEDAVAEGVPDPSYPNGDSPRARLMSIGRVLYAELWDSINGPGAWKENPWVWVIEFKRIQP